MGIDNIEFMSDEEFINSSDEIFTEPTVTDGDDDSNNDNNYSDEAEVEAEVDTNDDNHGDDGFSGTNGDSEDDSNQDDLDPDEDQDDSDENDVQVDNDTDTPDEENDTDDTNANIDFEAGYKEIFEPLKANGKMMQIDSVEDVRTLMQKGIGFEKRMSQLKPHLKIIKSLKNNGLLDLEKINHLIDLGNGDAAAIAKLISETGINPLDIDTGEGVKEYKPKNHEVSDTEYNLDQAINSISSNDSYERSIKIMGEDWDEKSREIIKDNPEIVEVVDSHVQSGVFDVVQNFIEKEKALGRMSDVADVEAYRAAITALKESGVITSSNTVNGDSLNVDTKAKANVNPLKAKAKDAQEAKRKARRRAAAPNKSKPTPKGGKEKDYGSMTDDEFLAAIR